eukprot:228110-Prymnesium_polylepis.1
MFAARVPVPISRGRQPYLVRRTASESAEEIKRIRIGICPDSHKTLSFGRSSAPRGSRRALHEARAVYRYVLYQNLCDIRRVLPR